MNARTIFTMALLLCSTLVACASGADDEREETSATTSNIVTKERCAAPGYRPAGDFCVSDPEAQEQAEESGEGGGEESDPGDDVCPPGYRLCGDFCCGG